MTHLSDYGWTKHHQLEWTELALPGVQARVIADFGTSLKIATPEILTAELSGKLAHYTDRDKTPKVGDWVNVAITDNNNVIESVVLRSNEIARKVSGKRAVKQIIGANIDIAFVLVALDENFSVEKLKRFLYQLSSSSIEAVIVLNKADQTDDVHSYIVQIEQLGVPIITAIATEGVGVEEIAARIKPAKTAILLGSSGAGKSTLTNQLIGREIQATQEVRASDSTGRHTTVHRELFILPNKGILIDTPGIRELQLWGTEEELDENYDDIVAIARLCRYRTCGHTTEKDCAINAALRDGTLDEKHYANYVKMKAELAKLQEKKLDQIRQSRKFQRRSDKKRAQRDELRSRED